MPRRTLRLGFTVALALVLGSVRARAQITEMCPGNSISACPCNNYIPGNRRGCVHSWNMGGNIGARLAGTGNPIVSNDTVSVTGSAIREGNPTLALFFSGSEVTQNAVNDGSICAGSPTCRLWIWSVPLTGPQDHVTVTGPDASTSPDTSGTTISQRSADLGRAIQDGETRIYTIWYRDNGVYACEPMEKSNYTNGLRVTWSQ